jgi:PAS domain S-box-containing protein
MQLALPPGESLLQAVLAASPMALIVTTLDDDARLIAINDKFTDLLGYRPGELGAGAAWWSLIFPEPVERSRMRVAWSAAVRSAARGHASSKAIEASLRCHDASLREVELYVGVKDCYAFALCKDMTAQRRSERELSEARGFLQCVVDTSPNAIFVVDESSRLVFVNRWAADFYGTTPEEMLSKSALEVHGDAEQAAGYMRDDLQVIRAGKELVKEELVTANDGQPRWFQTVKVPLERPDGRIHCLAISTEITAHKQAEEARLELEAKISRSQKLESLAVLASGIAHDFNNLLASIRTNAYLAKARLPMDSSVQPLLEGIDQATRQAAQLTDQMLAYVGRGPASLEPLSLDELVAERQSLLEAVSTRHAQLQFQLEPAPVTADAAQMHQLLMNLVANASDALDSAGAPRAPGLILVRTGELELAGGALRSNLLDETLPDGRYSYLEVEDNGCGMSRETLSRIYEPFYTTKFSGRGLGLSAVLGIVRGHSGTLEVGSQLGQGSRFRVLLPQARRAALQPPLSAPPAPSLLSGPTARGTVLVVDDEQLVRTTLCMALEDSGFQVHAAENGRAGLELFQRHAGEIDAVVLDLTMPELDGWQCLDRLRAIRRDLPVILISGYAAESSAPAHITPVPTFLRKPFDPDDLVREAARLVASRRLATSAN